MDWMSNPEHGRKGTADDDAADAAPAASRNNDDRVEDGFISKLELNPDLNPSSILARATESKKEGGGGVDQFGRSREAAREEKPHAMAGDAGSSWKVKKIKRLREMVSAATAVGQPVSAAAWRSDLTTA